jgi:hypothetical protein
MGWRSWNDPFSSHRDEGEEGKDKSLFGYSVLLVWIRGPASVANSPSLLRLIGLQPPGLPRPRPGRWRLYPVITLVSSHHSANPVLEEARELLSDREFRP